MWTRANSAFFFRGTQKLESAAHHSRLPRLAPDWARAFLRKLFVRSATITGGVHTSQSRALSDGKGASRPGLPEGGRDVFCITAPGQPPGSVPLRRLPRGLADSGCSESVREDAVLLCRLAHSPRSPRHSERSTAGRRNATACNIVSIPLLWREEAWCASSRNRPF